MDRLRTELAETEHSLKELEDDLQYYLRCAEQCRHKIGYTKQRIIDIKAQIKLEISQKGTELL